MGKICFAQLLISVPNLDDLFFRSNLWQSLKTRPRDEKPFGTANSRRRDECEFEARSLSSHKRDLIKSANDEHSLRVGESRYSAGKRIQSKKNIRGLLFRENQENDFFLKTNEGTWQFVAQNHWISEQGGIPSG